MSLTAHAYQERVRDETVGFIQKLLAQTRVFGWSQTAQCQIKMPTGAGKTFTVAETVRRVAHETDPIVNGQCMAVGDVVFVLIAPNSLHKQHLDSLRGYGLEDAGLRILTGEDLLSSPKGVSPNDLVVVNWASVNGSNNRLMVDSETGANLETIFGELHAAGIQVILIQDEAHHSANTSASEAVRRALRPTVVVNVTATPEGVPGGDNCFSASHSEVVDTGAIVKKTLIEDPDVLLFEQKFQNEHGIPLSSLPDYENKLHVWAAVCKARMMDVWYEAIGSPVRTVAGVQLPMDPSKPEANLGSDSAKEKRSLNDCLDFLETYCGYSVGEEVAVMLSGDKRGFDDTIKLFDSPVKVLIFKFAVAVGYDLPRMKTGALLMDAKKQSFAIQVVGRFIRQPEQKHYADERLNLAYLYTSKELLGEIIRNHGDEVAVAPQRMGLRPDLVLTASTAAKIGSAQIPNWYRVNAGKARVKLEDMKAALNAVYLQRSGDKAGIAFTPNPPQFLKSWGFANQSLAQLSLHSSELSDADSASSLSSGEGFSMALSTERVEQEFRTIFKEEWQRADSRTVKNWLTSWNDLLVSVGVDLDFVVLLKKVMGSDQNRNVLRSLIREVQLEVFKLDPGYAAVGNTLTPTVSPWTIPSYSIASEGEKGVLNLLPQAQYLYDSGIPTELLDSSAERDFAISVVPRVAALLESKGLTLLGFFKNDVAGERSLSIPVELDVNKAPEDQEGPLFHPDWILVLQDASLDLHLLVIETKRQKKDGLDSKIYEKANAMERWCVYVESRSAGLISLHGVVANMDGYHPVTSPDKIEVVGLSDFLFSWLDSIY